ncbi:MAG: MFS transporter, partial [Deltaproteobacteria bacterium]|nr:MFS transporter [Deltaproteobacteria bacterium]
MAAPRLPAIPEAAGHEAAGALWSRPFLIFLLVYFCVFMSFYMQFSTLSPYLASQGLSHAAVGLVIGSFTLTSIASRLLSARLAVAWGPLKTARAGLAIIAVGILFFFVRPGAPFFTAARLLQGAGFGLVSTLLISVVVKLIPHDRLGEGLGYMGLSTTVAMAAGPLAGLELSGTFGYRAMFIAMDVAIAASIVVSLMLPGFLEAREAPAPPPPGGRGAVIDFRPIWPGALALFYAAGITAVTVYLAVYCSERHLPSAAAFFLVSTIG